MKSYRLVLALVIAMASSAVCQALDSIRTSKGVLSGRVIGMDATKVDFEQGVGASALLKELPANEVQAIYFEGEPRDLRNAKNEVLRGRYAEALEMLEQMKDEPVRPEAVQDLQFYKAYCAAKLALGGSGKIPEAGKMMLAFVDGNPKSYHYYQATAMVGDLLVAIRQYSKAGEYYSRLQNAPWPDYKMRAGVAIGKALLDQDKADQALAAFDKVIATEGTGELAQEQRLFAAVGKARALVALTKAEEAIKLLEEVLKKADAEHAPLMAQAYNAQGAAYKQAGRIKEAQLAYLHVDMLYSSQPAAHAEALANLVELWEQDHQRERANRHRQVLEEQYPDSPWAKKAGN